MKTTTKKVEIPHKRPRGGQTKYNPELHPAWVKSLAQQNLIEEKIAVYLNISVMTLNTWKKKYPEFALSLKEGKKSRNAAVERSLFDACQGYEYEEQILEPVYHPKTKKPTGKFEVTRIIKKHKPKSTAAIEFYLTNVMKDKWKNRQNMDIDGTLSYKVIPDDLDAEKEKE